MEIVNLIKKGSFQYKNEDSDYAKKTRKKKYNELTQSLRTQLILFEIKNFLTGKICLIFY